MILNSRSLMLLYGATSLRMCATYATAAYLPVFFAREWPSEDSNFSLAHAACLLLGGGASSLIGGRMADTYGAKEPRVARLSLSFLLLLLLLLLLLQDTDSPTFAQVQPHVPISLPAFPLKPAYSCLVLQTIFLLCFALHFVFPHKRENRTDKLR